MKAGLDPATRDVRLLLSVWGTAWFSQWKVCHQHLPAKHGWGGLASCEWRWGGMTFFLLNSGLQLIERCEDVPEVMVKLWSAPA